MILLYKQIRTIWIACVYGPGYNTLMKGNTYDEMEDRAFKYVCHWWHEVQGTSDTVADESDIVVSDKTPKSLWICMYFENHKLERYQFTRHDL